MLWFVIFLLFTPVQSQLLSKYEIELKVTGDFPEKVYIFPETITLNGKSIKEYQFGPGNYELYIFEPGYFPLRKQIIISQDHELLTIEEVLIAKPRKVEIKITHDIESSRKLRTKITLTLRNDLSQEKELKVGDLVKPGRYILKITEPDYQIIEINQNVWPDERPYVIDQKLYAKQVMIFFEITHDIAPLEKLEPYSVDLIAQDTRVLFLEDGPFIRCGLYHLRIRQPGYHTIGPMDFYIAPGDKPFVKKRLIARKRGISLEIDNSHIFGIFDVTSIVNALTQEPITYYDTFQPGTTLLLEIKSKFWETINMAVKIVPGKGRQIILIRPKIGKNKWPKEK